MTLREYATVLGHADKSKVTQIFAYLIHIVINKWVVKNNRQGYFWSLANID